MQKFEPGLLGAKAPGYRSGALVTQPFRTELPARPVSQRRYQLFPFLCLVLVLVFPVFSFPSPILAREELWKRIDDGLFLSEIDSKKLTLLKIDPAYYSFRLLSASEKNRTRMTAKEWCQKYNLISAINAGMFQVDGMTNVGFMKNFNHINSPRLNSTYRAVLAFNPTDTTVPAIQIIDLTCQDIGRVKDKYHTLIQGIRMVSCRQENVWEKQERRYSIAAFGIDKSGHGLFILSESPSSVHDFINHVLSLPILLYNALYLEGGPEATLYFSTKGVEFEKIGSHEGGFSKDGFSKVARPLPNVIGIVRKPEQP